MRDGRPLALASWRVPTKVEVSPEPQAEPRFVDLIGFFWVLRDLEQAFAEFAMLVGSGDELLGYPFPVLGA